MNTYKISDLVLRLHSTDLRISYKKGGLFCLLVKIVERGEESNYLVVEVKFRTY